MIIPVIPSSTLLLVYQVQFRRLVLRLLEKSKSQQASFGRHIRTHVHECRLHDELHILMLFC